MKFSELLQTLSYGELSNLAMSGEGNGAIQTASRPKIAYYTNEALLRLYSRFVLKETDVLVQMYEHITFYHLNPRFALTYIPQDAEDDEPIRYLLDLPKEPFLGDIIKVTGVFDSRSRKLPLNDDAHPLSVFTPQATILQVPRPKQDQSLSVLYQARHRKLLGVLEENIELPEILLGALTSYIAYKVFSHMNTQDSTAKAQEYLRLYEATCADIVEKDLVNASISLSNTRFHQRGWV